MSAAGETRDREVSNPRKISDRRWRRRLERVLWCLGALLLGWVGWGWADGEIYQRQQERLLEEALREQARTVVEQSAQAAPADQRGARSSATGAAAGTAAAADAVGEGSVVDGASPEKRTTARSASTPRASRSTETATRTAAVTPLARIEVPRLHLEVMIADGIDSRTLRRAVGHIPGTARLGSGGNVGLAGHRDSYFRPLERVKVGDEVVVTTATSVSSYLVEWTQVVSPESREVLAPTAYPALTLVTCYPFHYVGEAPDRFVVRARLVESRAPRASDSRLTRGR